jgi:Peptidase family M28
VSAQEISSRIAQICGFEDRLAGTDAERRLANEVAGELETADRIAAVEPIWVQPQWAIVHLVHCLLALGGSVVASRDPVVGFAIVLATATSAYLDLSARWYLIRPLLFRRASQNVHVHPREEAGPDSPRVILCANLDAPRTGATYNPLPMRLLDLASRRFPVLSSPTRIWFWSIALLLLPIGARMAGLDAAWLDAVQLIPTLILIVACFLLGEIALSPPSPGANANASGVAALIAALSMLDDEPLANVRVEAAICGGGETTMQGMRSFVRSHRGEYGKPTTRFVSFESVGRGEPRFAISQGLAVSLPLDPDLAELCAAVAIAHDGGEDPYDAEPIRDGRASAAMTARAYGFPAIAITCREGDEALPAGHHTPSDAPASIDPEAVDRAAGFAVEAIRLLDRDLGRPTPAAAAAPAATSAG